MGKNIKEWQQEVFRKIENHWLRRSFAICFALAFICGISYYFGLIKNFRFAIINIINFASIIIGVTGVFITLLITLKESPAFKRLRDFFPVLNVSLYKHLRNQINYSLVVILLSIFIYILPPSPNKILSAVGVMIWFWFFWLMSIGAFYTVKLVIDLVIRNDELPKPNNRRE